MPSDPPVGADAGPAQFSAATTRLVTALGGRYRIERELGAGGMATVYLAVDSKHERRVAIKVLRPELAAIIGAERFVREIKTIAALQHPHILGLIDSGEVNGTAFYVMPFVEGESLRDRLAREKQLPVSDAVRIATEVAAALDYAHRHGIIHRDIKPENVMLHDGSAMVADFGIALAVSSAGGTRMTETGMSLGTPHYMSPEQAMGDREITAASDVYALGAMTYEMLVGDPPFTGSTAQAIVARALTESPRAITAQRHTIPPHVEAAVLTALEKLPADRFATAAEFSEALRSPGASTAALQRMHATVGARSAAGGRAWQFATVAAAVVLGGLAAWEWSAARRAADAPASWQYVELGDTVGVWFGTPSLALSRDGNTLLFKATATGPLWLKHRGELEASPLAGTEGGSDGVISPDGQWVTFVVGGALKKIQISGGAPITLATGVADGYGGQTWLDDKTVIYVVRSLGALRSVNASGGGDSLVLRDTTLFGGGIGTPVPLPDRRGVLFQYCTSGCATDAVHVLDLHTGAQRVLLKDVVQAWYLPSGRLLYVRRDGAGFVVPFDLKTLTMRGDPVQVLQGVASSLVNGFSSLAVSRTGTLVYFGGPTTGAVASVVRMSTTGVPSSVDTSWSTTPNSMALSPDGRRLAVGAGSTAGGGGDGMNIWIKQLDAGPFTRLTFGNSDRRPAWSPDGKMVAFLRDSGTTSSVYEHPADGSGPDRFLARLDRQVQEATWSPDGKWLVLRTDNGTRGNADIVGVRVGGDSKPVPIVASSFSELEPAISPDGKWIAYSSDQSGIDEVYVRGFLTPGGQWQVSNGGGTEPEWSPDGSQLYFVGANQEFMVASVSTKSTFFVHGLKQLFSTSALIDPGYHQSYAIAPDGKSFYFALPGGAAAAAHAVHIVWVDHWFSDLEQRLKR